MKNLLFIATFFINSAFCQKSAVRINLALIDSSTAMQSKFLVEVKNLSKDSISVPTELTVGIQNNSGTAIGNLIVEIQQKKDSNYILLSPTAFINPVFYPREYRMLKPNGIIIDTIHLEGRLWSSKGLPKGEYRIKVYFNFDEMERSKDRSSGWVSFTIK